MSDGDAGVGRGDVPPRPDPYTGQPFPPCAPGFRGKDVAIELDPGRERRVSRRPKGPCGKGPPLVWHRENKRSKLVTLIITVSICAGIMLIVAAAEGIGLEFITAWQIWVIILVGGWLMAGPLDYVTTAAGADWLQVSRNKRWYRRRGSVQCIDIYEIERIEGFISVGGTRYLTLEDSSLAWVDRSVDELQVDRRIWDLLYNGIVHSLAQGAEINAVGRGILQLDSGIEREGRHRSVDDQAGSERPDA